MWDASAPVAVAPSPNVQLCETTVPSGSLDPRPSTATARPAVDVVNAAVGAKFGAWLPVPAA